MNTKVDDFLNKAQKWQREMEILRTIILGCGLTEDFKWSKPCYSYQKSNVVIIQGFKKYLALMFFKGSLLKDKYGILVKPGENAQTIRQIRFANIEEIVEMEANLKAYIYEAIEVQKTGLKVDFKAKKELIFPEEFQKKIDENPLLKTAFDTLTPGRQRAYNIYFSQPKQSKTRKARIEKCIPKIFEGKGLDDR
jgi:uncharacterized protein YdeI (YjbR/CyaY-like superfamily)